MNTEKLDLGNPAVSVGGATIDRPSGTDSPLPLSEGGHVVIEPGEDAQSQENFRPEFRLMVIIGGLAVTALLTAMENTVVTVAAPVILEDLQLGEDYVWVNNIFFLCSAAVQPLAGQLSNVFGRRWVMLSSVAIFTLGSGICGGATNAGMLIGGRGVQGAGSGGVTLLADIIVSDLVPLRFRGNYIAVILGIYGVGLTLGPFIGGAIVSATTWRWVFYMNLPIGGASLLVLYFFLHMNYDRDMTFEQKMRRIDWLGNAVLTATTVAILYALAYAGTLYAWDSWHTLVPLILGIAGLFLFAYLEMSGFSAEPVMPMRLFTHRTSIVISINTWINSALVYWGVFFLPIYFQAVQLYSPRRTGVALLPQSLVAIPGAAIAAVALSRWGRYKPIHTAGFATFALGLGLLSLQHEDTTVAQWVIYQCVVALGAGMMLNTQLPAFQAPVSEKDQAAATAAWCFVRSFGFVWGVAIPSAIFNNRIDALVGSISDPVAAQLLGMGGAYGAASAAQIEQFPLPIQNEMRAVYSQALQRVFQISIVFAGIACLLSLLENEVVLRTTLETEYGLKPDEDRVSDKTAAQSSDAANHPSENGSS